MRSNDTIALSSQIMKFVTFRNSTDQPEVGVLDGANIYSLAGAGILDMTQLAALGAAGAVKKATAAIAAKAAKVPAKQTKLMAPVLNPSKILCVGLNYRDHAIESNMAIPKFPTIFSKFNNTIIGQGDTIVLPKQSTQPDYEAEMAVVIGVGGKHIAARSWKKHVFGYMNLHDVSARDLQLCTTQWLMGKSPDTFAPCGPWIVSADEIADPHNLNIKITVSGEVLQKSNTKHLIFDIPKLISYISSVMTLQPGDIISTGTPAGVGFARKPPRLLRDGDVCIVEVQGLGKLENPVALEK